MRARVIGVHKVETDEPVWLIELAVDDDLDGFSIDDITQEQLDLSRMSWQAAYDEQWLVKLGDYGRLAFFFHELDLTKPLLTSFGSLALPDTSELPEHLKRIRYEKPC